MRQPRRSRRIGYWKDDAVLAPGSAIQLVVYQDEDGDPANGAVLLLALDETVQSADGVTFSIYPLPAAVEVRGGGSTSAWSTATPPRASRR